MNYGRDLTKPYTTIPHEGIVYSVCRDFNHISRYRDLRQVIHYSDEGRHSILETANPFVTNLQVKYHEVLATEENRLDIIAEKELGSATYSWVLAYFNRIEDGFTVREGQKLVFPKDGVTALLNNGEVLAPITALKLNLGEE